MALFVDTNVFIYAVGRPHPLREVARSRFDEAITNGSALATSAEVLQELLHAYLPVGRLATLDAAMRLARDLTTVWPIEANDVEAARDLVTAHPGLAARDLIHLAICRRYGATAILSFDRGLIAAFGQG